MSRQTDIDQLYHFKLAFRKVFCGRTNRTSDCPKFCPGKDLTINSWNTMKLSDLIGVKEDKDV